VRRTDRDLLPPRYHTAPIYYRHVPRVPVRWLQDSQLLLLRELSVEPGTFEALRQRTSFSVKQLEHDLTCLYYASSITTTPSRAAQPSPGLRDSYLPSYGPGLESLLSSGIDPSDLTAPALLERRPGAPKATPAPR
jgi:hypothetical protein